MTPSFAVPVQQTPSASAAPVTPSDTVDLSTPSMYLYIGSAGDVTVNTVGGSVQVLFKAVPAGTVLPVRASRVWATGTTAGSIVALW